MKLTNWMSEIADSAKITKIAIPGAHNAGSWAMNKMARCQGDGIFRQFQCGVRQFCIRLNTNRRGEIVLSHGISGGGLFENSLGDLQKALEYDGEVLILDIREYYEQKFGPVTLRYKASPKMIDELLEKYICPEKYAFYDFDDISKVTLGDIRNSGKKYIIVNDNEDYRFSKNCKQTMPWDKEIYGLWGKDFSKRVMEVFDSAEPTGLFWFQTQQTPNLGTAIGVTNPYKLDLETRKYFPDIISAIEKSPERLEKVNIIAGDFMTDTPLKAEKIIALNSKKGLTE